MTWNLIFGRAAPLELEIGFGNGEALVRRAGERPDLNHVGIEISWESVKRALRRVAKAGKRNVRLLQCDAHLAMLRCFTPRSIRRAYALFPAPWPKKRQARRRLFSKAFLEILANRLDDHGTFQIVTDYQPLAEWILSQVPGSGFQAELTTTPARFQTKYERKWLDNGQETFYELALNKERHPEVSDLEDVPLLSVRLKNFRPDGYRPVSETGPITIKFEEFLYDPIRKKALIRTLVAEERLIQTIYIQIAYREEYWHLGLDQTVNVVPTAGVRRAIELLAMQNTLTSHQHFPSIPGDSDD